jgi:selenide, water dikinase
VLGRLPKYPHPDVLVGFDTADDAGVFRLDAERALVQTLDFFTPVVDDPRQYGAIAAANSLSDVYAMGGRPITAMAIACFPEKGLAPEVLLDIMAGGLEKLREAGVVLLGGHTVSDPEIKFGYSITGLIHPNRVLTNAGAKAGDALLLTKPLGIGLIASGIKFGRVSEDAAQRAIEIMKTLNRTAAETMLQFECHAVTDITGNGLLGHAYEMAEASGVTIRFDSARVPYLPEALALARSSLLPRTIAATWEMIRPRTRVSQSLADEMRHLLLDPQTSGGLLIAVARVDAQSLVGELQRREVAAVEIGAVLDPSGYLIEVV